MKKPKILLVGAGRFGKKHLRNLLLLEKRGKLTLAGIVVKTKKFQQELQKEYNIPIFTDLKPSLLKKVDAVDIVTSYPTHFSLVKKCLRYTNVFVEKPLASTAREANILRDYANKHKKVLMVGHIYRFHPLTEKLKSLAPKFKNLEKIEGEFISPVATYEGQDPLLEELHWFDVLDYLFGEKPKVIWSKGTKYLKDVYLRYPNGTDAHFKIGWRNDQKIRTLNFVMSNKKKIVCDFTRPVAVEPLKKELMAFIGALRGRKIAYPNGEVGARIIEIIELAKRSWRQKNPRVAIIGGGIFGATAALILGKYFPVTMFEKKSRLLAEASWANQYRHHYGYHYPRSPETIREINEKRRDFENFYGQAIVSNFPSYYCVSCRNSLVSADKFLKICKENRLPAKKEYPPSDFLNRNTVNLSIRTPESVYDYKKLKNIIERKIKQNRNIVLKLNSEVTNAKISPDGRKILSIRSGNNTISEPFDYVINATYAEYNKFCGWLSFPQKNLKFRLKEIIVARLKLKKRCAVTIMDGPFATLVPVGSSPDIYTFGDVPLSVHKSFNNLKSLNLTDLPRLPASRWLHMKKRCLKWFPLLKDAKYVKSMFVILPTETVSEKNDARPTDVVSHGSGCWSIFSGKILTCVSAAKKILQDLK